MWGPRRLGQSAHGKRNQESGTRNEDTKPAKITVTSDAFLGFLMAKEYLHFRSVHVNRQAPSAPVLKHNPYLPGPLSLKSPEGGRIVTTLPTGTCGWRVGVQRPICRAIPHFS